MEHLSNVIKSLFTKEDGDYVLMRAGFVSSRRSSHMPMAGAFSALDREINESDIYRLVRDSNAYNTLDQQIVVGQVLLSKWIFPEENCRELRFNRQSIFNSLLHFGQRTIKLQDNEPVCSFTRLFRWHFLTSELGEDLFTTSYLASRDLVSRHNRKFFDWAAFVPHDNKELNHILHSPITDLHMHLKGSSFNFDISWLSAMNNIDDMHTIFNDISEKRNRSEDDCGLYDKIRRASYIRLYLASRTGLISKVLTLPSLIRNLFDPEDANQGTAHINPQANECLRDCEVHYDDILKEFRNQQLGLDKSDMNRYDYINFREYGTEGIFQILATERSLMYSVFQKIFEGDDENLGTLFYAYLCYKTLFRHRIIQLNSRTGFANFSDYEAIKDTYIVPNYEGMLIRASIESFLSINTNRYLETRIVPKNTAKGISESIKKIISVVDDRFNDPKSPRFNIILHFIKKRDPRDGQAYRHFALREEVKQQAFAIYRFRNDTSDWKKDPASGRVVGIDAANSELYCRPEVYGQAFRFLRNHNINSSEDVRPNDLSITYHVGEDFYDIADGLRAIEEALIFFEMKNGDRLGHCLALGTDAKKYYESRYYTICAPKQVILDNLAWLHHKCRRLIGDSPLCEYLESEFHRYFRDIFLGKERNVMSILDITLADDKENNSDLDDIHAYYLSWLLRGNAPCFGLDLGKIKNDEIHDPIEKEWAQACIYHHRAVENACNNSVALTLFDQYHKNNIDKAGDAADTFNIRKPFRRSFLELLERIQEQLLTKIEKRRIAIECNPSSNFKIGEFNRYDMHPIIKFFNYGLNVPYPRHDIAVSINTDDQGVFSTSLEREYSLMALALERNETEGFNNSPRQIIDWLDRVRQMGVEQKFYPTI